jgi:hypothetical protein
MSQITQKLKGGAHMRGIAVMGLALLAAASLPAATVAIGQLQLTNANGYQALTFYNFTGVGNGGCDGAHYEVCNGVTIQTWTLKLTYTNTGASVPTNAAPGSTVTFSSGSTNPIAPYGGSGPGYAGTLAATWEIPLTGVGGTEPACPPCDYQLTQVEFSGTFNSANIPFTIGSASSQSQFGANPTFDTVWSIPAADYGANLNPQFFGDQVDITATDQQTTPLLFITKSHAGSFTQGQTGAAYQVTVANQTGAVASSGTVTVTENPPSGETLTGMSGTGWTCGGSACTRSDALAGGASYPPIAVAVSVASNANSPQVNSVTVSGGGSASATATDSTAVTVPVTPLGTVTASAVVVFPGSGYTIPASICNYGALCSEVWVPGGFNIPVTLALNTGTTVNSLQFGVQLTPNGAAPGLTGSLNFAPAGSITNTPVVGTANTSNSISAQWTTLSTPLTGTAAVGNVTGTVPASAGPGQSYAENVTAPSGASGSTPVPLAAGAAGTLSVAQIYLAGDVAPYTTNASPGFGDGEMDIRDLIQELFAVNNVSGFVPSACSDRLDAMDLYPPDVGTTRGGDGLLDIRDLILELFRANNLDNARPVRTSRGGVCAVGTSSVNSTQLTRTMAAPRPQGAIEGAIVLGSAENAGGGQQRVAVYLEARSALNGVAVTFGLGDQQSQLKFLAGAIAPSLLQDSQRGVVAAAWTSGVSVRAGQRLLLGYVEGPTGFEANLRVFGASASGVSDNRAVRLALPGGSAQ